MKNRNLFWGVVFILAAAFILLGRVGFFSEINMTRLLLALLLLYCIARNVRCLNFYGILIPAALICILYDDLLHITMFTPFPILAASVFASIGLTFLFPGHAPFSSDYTFDPNDRGSEKDRCGDSEVTCSVSFAGTSKYIEASDFRRAYLKCTFGALKVFFDHARITEKTAEIYVENSFGETALFLPKEWNVFVDVATSFGDIEEIHKPVAIYTDAPSVTVRGRVSFGDCKIYYI